MQINIDPLPLLVLFGLPLFGWWLDWKTWLKITDNELISSGHFEFRGPERIPIHYVKEVRRVRQNILIPHFGSFIALYGEDGLLMKVREANYSRRTIRRFIGDLKEKLPFAQFDPQYEELIEKPLEELPDFKRTPATHDSF